MTLHHYRTCTLCEAMCGLDIEVAGEEILSIRGDQQDPFSQGHICPKAVALQDLHTDPDRLRYPLRRTDGGWVEIGWEEAFRRVVQGISGVQAIHGKDAVAVYQGNPSVHNYGTSLFSPGMVRALGTRNRFSATSVDQLPHHLVAYLLYGHGLLLPVPDVDRTDHMLILGANPAVSNGSMMTAPGMGRRLKAIKARGGRVVVIDPRRTETAALADQHHFIRPGTDVLLLLAMVETLFAEDLVDTGTLTPLLKGTDALREAVQPFAPERVAAATGIAAATIRSLARDFAGAERAVCYGRMGVSVQAFGTACQWLINVLNILTGNLDRPGGAMFTDPAFEVVAKGSFKPRFGRWRSRVRGLPEFGGELPVVALAEEMTTPGPGQVKALITSAGNPVLSTPNGRQLEEALSGLAFMVSVDFYLNETTRHAHIILPPTGPLEHDHYDVIFHLLAVRNTAKYSPPLFEPSPGTRHDWQIFLELETRLRAGRGLWSRVKAHSRAFVLRRLGPQGLLARQLRRGPYGRTRQPALSLKALRKAPHGIDLGPLQPGLPDKLKTPDGCIDLAPELCLASLTEAKALLGDRAAAAGLQLIGRRDLRSNNSWMHNARRLVKGRDRCVLLMHPDDAKARAVSPGDRVTVRSSVGEVTLPVEVTSHIMPGVVSIPHGWGHHRPGTRMRVAEAHAGVSINDLTDEQRVDAASGNAALSGVAVEVMPAGVLAAAL